MNFVLKLIISGLFIPMLTFAKKEIPFMHSAISESNGRVYQYSVIFQEITLKTNPHVTYAWQRNGQLRSTRGDFSGNILHGNFQEFDKSGKMMEKGNYYYGAKDGEWKSWNRNGEIIRLEKWDKGFLNKRQSYENSKYTVEHFKLNQLNGRRIIFNNNHKDLVEHFRKGKLIVKNKRFFKSNVKHKKQTKGPDELSNN
jgi:antitoxin component YwqK of YwqJK toxin-antitoxin module